MSEGAEIPATARHVAIIMDGNGRWARSRNMPRTKGHQKGLESVKRSIESAIELKVEYLTLFGFSSENWSRPKDEVSELMRLLRYYLRSETADLHKSGIRLRIIGDRSKFAPDIIELIENAERLTVDNKNLNLIIALNYGGRQDILQASKQLADHAWRHNHQLTEEEVEALLPQFLYTAGIPDPDLMIRTSGEKRISNFLIWSCAYTEFVFTDVLWPDFNKADFQAALQEYASRDRRYGGLKNTESK